MISINFFADIFRLTAQILRIHSARLLNSQHPLFKVGKGMEMKSTRRNLSQRWEKNHESGKEREVDIGET